MLRRQPRRVLADTAQDQYEAGIAVSTVQDRINYLVKRKLAEIKKHIGPGKYKNNVYVLLSQDNPDIYRDLDEPEELPLF